MSKLSLFLFLCLTMVSWTTCVARTADQSGNKILDRYMKASGGSKIVARRVRRDTVKKERTWPGGMVPFMFSEEFTNQEIYAVELGMDEFHLETCLRFGKRKTEENYLFIYKNASESPDTCGTYGVGMVGGKLRVMLNSGCLTRKTVLHELMHAIGFYHEQNRHDRSDNVEIKWQNIREGTADDQDQIKHQFYKTPEADPSELPYDYKSLMHYTSFAFNKKGYETIVPKKAGGFYDINDYEKVGFSDLDIQKINKLYNCDLQDVLRKKDKIMRTWQKQYIKTSVIKE